MKVYIVSDTEVRATLVEDDGTEVSYQKKVSLTSNPDTVRYFDNDLIHLIGLYLFYSPEIREAYGDKVKALGYAIFAEDLIPNFRMVRSALLDLLKVWARTCQNDPNCVMFPSTEMMEDKAVRKVVLALKAKQDKVDNLSTELAALRLAGSP